MLTIAAYIRADKHTVSSRSLLVCFFLERLLKGLKKFEEHNIVKTLEVTLFMSFSPETDTIYMKEHPDCVVNVSYSLLFKIQTTVAQTQFSVDDSSSLGIINGNSYSFFSSCLF